MNYELERNFKKDMLNIKNKELFQAVKDVITVVANAKDIREIKNLKKLKGYKTYYRISTGSYRAGIEIVNKTVFFSRFLDRKDIYKYFPK
jgi:mRNA interferase RelE/StbE